MPDFGEPGVDLGDSDCDGAKAPDVTIQPGHKWYNLTQNDRLQEVTSVFDDTTLEGRYHYEGGEPTERCYDGYDNDFDGLMDYEDPDCRPADIDPENINPVVYYSLNDTQDFSQADRDAICTTTSDPSCTGGTFTCEAVADTGQCPSSCEDYSDAEEELPMTGGSCPTGYVQRNVSLDRSQDAPTEDREGSESTPPVEDGTVTKCFLKATCQTSSGDDRTKQCQSVSTSMCESFSQASDITPGVSCSVSYEETGYNEQVNEVTPDGRYLCAAQTDTNWSLEAPGELGFLDAEDFSGNVVVSANNSYTATDGGWYSCNADLPDGYECRTIGGDQVMRRCCTDASCEPSNNPLSNSTRVGGLVATPGDYFIGTTITNQTQSPSGDYQERFSIDQLTAREDDKIHVTFSVSNRSDDISELNLSQSTVTVQGDRQIELNISENTAHGRQANTYYHLATRIDNDLQIDAVAFDLVFESGPVVNLRPLKAGVTRPGDQLVCGQGAWAANPDGTSDQGYSDSASTGLDARAACTAMHGKETAWTGSACCGDDSVDGFGETYTDDVGSSTGADYSCYKGTPVEDPSVVGQSVPRAPDQGLLLSNHTYRRCNYDTAERTAYNASQNGDVIPSVDTFFQTNGFLCQPEGWIKSVDSQELYRMANMLYNHTKVASADTYSLVCGSVNEVANEDITAEPETPACALRLGPNDRRDSDNLDTRKTILLLKHDVDNDTSVLSDQSWFFSGDYDLGSLVGQDGTCYQETDGVQLQRCDPAEYPDGISSLTSGAGSTGVVTKVYVDNDDDYIALSQASLDTGIFNDDAWTITGNPVTRFFSSIITRAQLILSPPPAFPFEARPDLAGIHLTRAPGGYEASSALYRASQDQPPRLRAQFHGDQFNKSALESVIAQYTQDRDTATVTKQGQTYNATIPLPSGQSPGRLTPERIWKRTTIPTTTP